MVEELKKTGIKNLRNEKWTIEEGIVIKEEYIYVPEENLRRESIHLYYNTPVGEHGERWKIAELVIRNYWWSGVIKEVGRYVDKYNAYQ